MNVATTRSVFPFLIVGVGVGGRLVAVFMRGNECPVGWNSCRLLTP